MTAQVLDSQPTTQSRVLETPAADSRATEHYFATKLQMETDPSDVRADQLAGVDDFVIVDVRSTEAYQEGHVPGAISLPHPTITAETVAALPAGKLLIAYCWGPGCNAGTKGARKLAALGLPVKEMIGGYEYWLQDGYPPE